MHNKRLKRRLKSEGWCLAALQETNKLANENNALATSHSHVQAPMKQVSQKEGTKILAQKVLSALTSRSVARLHRV